jgi:hypothetical protein
VKGNAPLNTLKAQPGQYDTYHPKFHALPGEYAKQQLLGNEYGKNTPSQTKHGSKGSSSEIQRALNAERQVHEYWEEWQGVTPGKAVYEDPRAWQNTLLPSAKYGTEGRGYG